MRKHRCCCSPELSLTACFLKLAITHSVNLGVSTSEHIARCHIANGASQAYGVVVIHVGLNQAHPILPGQRCAGPDKGWEWAKIYNAVRPHQSLAYYMPFEILCH